MPTRLKSSALARGATRNAHHVATAGCVRMRSTFHRIQQRIKSERICSESGKSVRSFYGHFLAGAVGGGTATYSTHWLDTVKVRMQTAPGQYHNGITCLRDIIRHEGPLALYKGAMPAMLGQMAKVAVVFSSYDICQQFVQRTTDCNSRDDMKLHHRACAGAMTGVSASFILCPIEVVKCRLQASVYNSRSGPASVLRHTLSVEGFRGLYRGLTGLWAKEIPGSFIYFGSYEAARMTLMNVLQTNRLDRKATFVCGMVSGVAFCVMHPIESVKTRVQVAQVVPNSMCTSMTKTDGFFRAMIQILKSEGFRPLWSGARPCMLRSCLYSGIQFVVFETVRQKISPD